MRSLRLCLTGAVLATAALTACSSDTAILLRVTRSASAPASIPRLHVAIGVESATPVVAPEPSDAPGTKTPAFVDDSAPDERIDVSDRDLAQSPYEILLRPSA